jgi:hypothetical protein
VNDKSPEEATAHFCRFAGFAAIDCLAASDGARGDLDQPYDFKT